MRMQNINEKFFHQPRQECFSGESGITYGDPCWHGLNKIKPGTSCLGNFISFT